MKKILVLLCLSFWGITSFVGYQDVSTVFLANEKDPYLKASFSLEEELKSLLEVETHAEFSAAFETAFQSDFDTEPQFEKLKTSNVDDWEMQLFEQRNVQMKFLKTDENYDNFSEEFVELIEANINYNYWHLLLAYSINRSNENTKLKEVTSLPRIMTEALDPAKINNPKRLLSKSYRAFLPYFVVYFNSENKKFKKYADGVKSISDKADYATKYLEGDVLDYTLTRLLAQNYELLTTTSFRYWTSQIYCQNLQEYLSDEYYDKVIEAEEAREKAVVAAAKLKDTKGELPSLMGLNDKSFTFDKYKGKVIYVDFWASWCGPCRAEFPYSKKMHEGLTAKQKKEIVFLYISIDQDIEKWKAAVQKLGLYEFGENAHSFEVSSRYKVSSIPRYMIIDKDGKVVNDRASRPSSEETLPALLELTK